MKKFVCIMLLVLVFMGCKNEEELKAISQNNKEIPSDSIQKVNDFAIVICQKHMVFADFNKSGKINVSLVCTI